MASYTVWVCSFPKDQRFQLLKCQPDIMAGSSTIYKLFWMFFRVSKQSFVCVLGLSVTCATTFTKSVSCCKRISTGSVGLTCPVVSVIEFCGVQSPKEAPSELHGWMEIFSTTSTAGSVIICSLVWCVATFCVFFFSKGGIQREPWLICIAVWKRFPLSLWLLYKNIQNMFVGHWYHFLSRLEHWTFGYRVTWYEFQESALITRNPTSVTWIYSTLSWLRHVKQWSRNGLGLFCRNCGISSLYFRWVWRAIIFFLLYLLGLTRINQSINTASIEDKFFRSFLQRYFSFDTLCVLLIHLSW